MSSTFTPQNPLFSPANDEEKNHDKYDLMEYDSVKYIPLYKLGFPDLEVLKEIAIKKSGLVLITGITCSGKTTTAKALVEHISRSNVSYDDPVEFVYDTLPEDNNKLKTVKISDHDFSEITNRSLRRKPDVIVLGELRNVSQFKRAAELSQDSLVIATMHASGVKGSIIQMEMFLRPFELSKIKMAAIIHQGMMRTKNGPKLISDIEISNFSIKEDKYTQRDSFIKSLSAMYNAKDITEHDVNINFGPDCFNEILNELKKDK